MNINTRHTPVALIVAGLLAVPAFAPADQAPSFGEIVDVRVINVEAVVTDNGQRVTDLGPEDFRLLVDGEEVPVEYFTEVRAGRAVTGDESDEAFALPALEPGEAVGTRYLVFIDDYFAVPSYRNRVLGDLAEQLPLMAADDRMAIVAFDGTEVVMLSSWTRSLADLGAALDRATKRRAYGLQRLSEQRQFDSVERFRGRGARGTRFASTAFASTRRGFLTLDEIERQRALEVADQVERVADAATSALRAFARPPGRKVMLLYSGGWPSSIPSWVAGTFEPVLGEGRLDELRPFDSLTETANRLGYTIYAADLNGLDRESFGSAELGSLLDNALAADRSFSREQLEEDTLFRLARATGGRAFIDGASHTALERAVEDTRSYYWLGFSPAWQENDEQHRVEVEVARKGLKVRSRDGFADLSRDSELTMMVESAQLFDLPLLGESNLAVSFGEPTGAGFKKVLLPVRVEIPLDYVTLLAESGGLAGELEMRVAAIDEGGDRADISMVPVAIRGTESSASGQVAVFETQLKLRRQPHRLLISLYDPPSGNMLSKRVEVSL
ncbi:MAG: VWA domain-containing protein [bacterium]|nr:VWA domain-containing protein [bacterium]